jgi:hypothetical protein
MGEAMGRSVKLTARIYQQVGAGREEVAVESTPFPRASQTRERVPSARDTDPDRPGTLSGEARESRSRCMFNALDDGTEPEMTTMTAITFVLVSLAAAAGLLVARRRRRFARFQPLDPLPAGMKHLAAHVGMLSDLGHGLPVTPGVRWRRLGSLLGVR